MRINIPVLSKKQMEAQFILEHGRNAFGETTAKPVKVEPEYRPEPPAAWGAMPGQADVGQG